MKINLKLIKADILELRIQRLKNNETANQQEMADLIGISKTWYRYITLYDKQPSLKILDKISAATGRAGKEYII